MAKRLTRITTKTGDDGTSGLADGSRLPKHDSVFEALGVVDELNSVLGVVVVALGSTHRISALLTDVQSRLFDLGAALSIPGSGRKLETAQHRLEEAIVEYNAALPPLEEFVVPGGTTAGAAMHVARTVARRAERAVWRLLNERQGLYERSLATYLNRLSDLCFVLARTINREQGADEPLWSKGDDAPQ
jgi:cob(I)alamin adenosyltransferase